MLRARAADGAGYATLFKWPPFGHFEADIPTSVLFELVPVDSS